MVCPSICSVFSSSKMYVTEVVLLVLCILKKISIATFCIYLTIQIAFIRISYKTSHLKFGLLRFNNVIRCNFRFVTVLLFKRCHTGCAI